MSFIIRKPDVKLRPNRFAGTSHDMTRKQLAYPLPHMLVNNDPDIVANFLFDSGAGSISSVQGGSLVLTPVGTPVYGVMEEGRYQKISPGIRYNGSSEHQKLTASSQLDLATTTEKFVFEWWIKTTDAISVNKHMWAYNLGSATTHGIQCIASSSNQVTIKISSDASATASAAFTVGAFNDGVPRLFRLVLDFEGLSTLQINSQQQDVGQDTSGLAGETFTNAGLRIGGSFDAVEARIAATYYGWRMARTTTPHLVNLAGPERP